MASPCENRSRDTRRRHGSPWIFDGVFLGRFGVFGSTKLVQCSFLGFMVCFFFRASHFDHVGFLPNGNVSRQKKVLWLENPQRCLFVFQVAFHFRAEQRCKKWPEIAGSLCRGAFEWICQVQGAERDSIFLLLVGGSMVDSRSMVVNSD
jgi:hypothetical protein